MIKEQDQGKPVRWRTEYQWRFSFSLNRGKWCVKNFVKSVTAMDLLQDSLLYRLVVIAFVIRNNLTYVGHIGDVKFVHRDICIS